MLFKDRITKYLEKKVIGFNIQQASQMEQREAIINDSDCSSVVIADMINKIGITNGEILECLEIDKKLDECYESDQLKKYLNEEIEALALQANRDNVDDTINLYVEMSILYGRLKMCKEIMDML